MDHKYQIGFIIEQTLGHITHGQNLQENIRQDPEINASWGLPSWESHGLETRLPLVRSNWTLRSGWQTRRILAQMGRKARLDVLFFHTQVTAVLSPDWLGRIPGVVSLDATPRQYDELGEYYQHASGSAWLERWKWLLNRNCFRRAWHLVTWSEWAKAGLASEYEVPEEKISVIPPGTDVQAWSCPEQGRSQEGTVRILFVGGDFKRKGGVILLEAFRRLQQQARRKSPVELHLVTREKIPPEPGVFVYNEMRPNTPALKQLYFSSHIFCLPTFGDCLPMVLSEAGAAGLPLVSTRLAAIPEIVRDGETGFLVPQGEAGPLADALLRLVEDADLRSRQGQSAFRLVSQAYDARCNAGRLVELLKHAADEKNTSKN